MKNLIVVLIWITSFAINPMVTISLAIGLTASLDVPFIRKEIES